MVFILHLIRDNILARKNGNVRPSESTKTVTEKFLKTFFTKSNETVILESLHYIRSSNSCSRNTGS